MVRVFGLLLLAASLLPVFADKRKVGWRADVLPDSTFLEPNGNGAGGTDLLVSAAVRFRRFTDNTSPIQIIFTRQPYMQIDENAGDSGPTIVRTETVQIPAGQTDFTQSFNFEVPAQNEQDQYIGVQLSGTPGYETTGTIFQYDSRGQFWRARNPGEYAAEMDEAVIGEIPFNDIVDGGEGGSDETPGRNDPTIAEPLPKEDGPPISNTTTTASMTSMTSVTSTVGGYPTTTPTPSRKPCKGKRAARHLAPRQSAPTTPTRIRLRVTHTYRDNTTRPVRNQRIIAVGSVYSGSTLIRLAPIFTTLSSTGQATITFLLSPGQRVEVRTLYTELVGSKYRVGTRASRSRPFTTTWLKLRLTVNPWLATQGQTISITNNYPRNHRHEGLWVADAFKTITDYARTQIIDTGIPQANIWYPNTEPGTTAFNPDPADPFIKLLDEDAQDPPVLAHEYGHLVHFYARGQRDLVSEPSPPGGHSDCTAASNGSTIGFKEGFATAFGLMSIDNTIFASRQGSGYMIYTDHRPDGTDDPTPDDFENYSCSLRILLRDEGRVTAAIADLVDRKLDVFSTADSDRGHVGAGFSSALLNVRFDPRLIFWDALSGNPANIEAYWRNLKGRLTATAQDKAWAVLEYNWADFAR